MQAFADAFATACTTGGLALAEQTAFAEAITYPIVEAIAFATGGDSCQGTWPAEKRFPDLNILFYSMHKFISNEVEIPFHILLHPNNKLLT